MQLEGRQLIRPCRVCGRGRPPV